MRTRMLVAALIAVSLLIDRGALGVVLAVFVIVVPFEKLFPRHQGQRVRRPELGTDLAFAISAPLLNVVTLVVAIVIAAVSLAWVPGLALRPAIGILPGWMVPLAGLLLFDLALYWGHRWAHEVPALWRYHAIHHSARTLDWISGFRVHPIDGVMIAPAFALLLGAGFSPQATGALAVAQGVVGVFLHANVRWRLRPLQKVVNTPELHHWHHSNEPDAHQKNYAALFPVWDLVFGTYFMPDGRRPAVYGIDDELPSSMVGKLIHPLCGEPNLLGVIRHPIRSLGPSVVRSRSCEPAPAGSSR